ncbi:Hypothetical_protein [Hexamita inflata]|uniref:Hypothetical_protein n=1 Tax=Hexamita inflata TaxID=28002 RepID=A0AA86U3R8_9EUKA|nr:Hypothetical protein HINF_LOCUS26296 [Hexamita inflata]
MFILALCDILYYDSTYQLYQRVYSVQGITSIATDGVNIYSLNQNGQVFKQLISSTSSPVPITSGSKGLQLSSFQNKIYLLKQDNTLWVLTGAQFVLDTTLPSGVTNVKFATGNQETQIIMSAGNLYLRGDCPISNSKCGPTIYEDATWKKFDFATAQFAYVDIRRIEIGKVSIVFYLDNQDVHVTGNKVGDYLNPNGDAFKIRNIGNGISKFYNTESQGAYYMKTNQNNLFQYGSYVNTSVTGYDGTTAFSFDSSVHPGFVHWIQNDIVQNSKNYYTYSIPTGHSFLQSLPYLIIAPQNAVDSNYKVQSNTAVILQVPDNMNLMLNQSYTTSYNVIPTNAQMRSIATNGEYIYAIDSYGNGFYSTLNSNTFQVIYGISDAKQLSVYQGQVYVLTSSKQIQVVTGMVQSDFTDFGTNYTVEYMVGDALRQFVIVGDKLYVRGDCSNGMCGDTTASIYSGWSEVLLSSTSITVNSIKYIDMQPESVTIRLNNDDVYAFGYNAGQFKVSDVALIRKIGNKIKFVSERTNNIGYYLDEITNIVTQYKGNSWLSQLPELCKDIALTPQLTHIHKIETDNIVHGESGEKIQYQATDFKFLHSGLLFVINPYVQQYIGQLNLTIKNDTNNTNISTDDPSTLKYRLQHYGWVIYVIAIPAFALVITVITVAVCINKGKCEKKNKRYQAEHSQLSNAINNQDTKFQPAKLILNNNLQHFGGDDNSIFTPVNKGDRLKSGGIELI